MSKYKPNKYARNRKCPYCGRIFKDTGVTGCQCNKSREIKDSFNRPMKYIGKNHQG